MIISWEGVYWPSPGNPGCEIDIFHIRYVKYVKFYILTSVLDQVAWNKSHYRKRQPNIYMWFSGTNCPLRVWRVMLYIYVLHGKCETRELANSLGILQTYWNFSNFANHLNAYQLFREIPIHANFPYNSNPNNDASVTWSTLSVLVLCFRYMFCLSLCWPDIYF